MVSEPERGGNRAGLTALTWIPFGPTSFENALEKFVNAALAAQ
jgi:hypothetical protein